LCDGRVEVPELPGLTHQKIVAAVYEALNAFVRPRKLGEVVFAPYPVKVGEKTFREPDLVFVSSENLARLGERFADVADLVVDVLSSDRAHDLVVKRQEYAAAGILEYWVVDIRDREVIVLTLKEGEYQEHGRYRPGDRASSIVLQGFGIDVSELMAVAD